MLSVFNSSLLLSHKLYGCVWIHNGCEYKTNVPTILTNTQTKRTQAYQAYWSVGSSPSNFPPIIKPERQNDAEVKRGLRHIHWDRLKINGRLSSVLRFFFDYIRFLSIMKWAATVYIAEDCRNLLALETHPVGVIYPKKYSFHYFKDVPKSSTPKRFT